MTSSWWACAVILLASCRPTGLPKHPQPLPRRHAAAAGQARAARIARSGQLLRGSLAGGRLGDFRVENGLFAAVVAGIGRPLSGALLDGCSARGGSDSLGSVAPVVGRSRLRTPSFDRLETEELGGTVTLRLRGHDPANPTVHVDHEYSVHPASPYLRITTTITNRGETALLQYRVGDRIDWGTAVAFAPGLGRAPHGTPALAWIGGWSDGASYAYYRRGSEMAGSLRSQLSTVVLDTLELHPGKQVEVQRLLAIGPGGDLGALLPHILAAQGVSSGRLDVTAYDEAGDPLRRALLEVALEGKPFVVGRTGDDGTASLFLPAGHFQVRAHTPDRTSVSAPVGIRPDRVTPLGLRTGPPSRLVYEVREAGSSATLPVKLTLVGVDGTPTPWLGPLCSASPANTLLARDGKGALPLPPGRYRITATHGPEYSMHSETLELRPDGGASFVASLKRVVSTSGYLGVDTTQRSLRTPGSCVTPAMRELNNLAEGVDGAVLADIDRPGRAGAAAAATLPGLSHRSPRLGWVTLYPVPTVGDVLEDPEHVLSGRPPRGMVIQLEGARRPDLGLFSRLEYDPEHPTPDAVPAAVNALRILDGRHPEDFDQLLEDWLSQLRTGRRLVATAGSGSRTVHGGEAGYPRTYVAVPKLLAPRELSRQITASLLQGSAVVSSGPFVQLTVNGAAPGETVSLSRRQREVELEVIVSAAEWIDLDSLTLYVDGQPWKDPIPLPGQAAGERLRRRLTLRVRGDSFVVALARGSAPLAPVVNSPGTPLIPIALTNPVWIDTDGNGRYDPPKR